MNKDPQEQYRLLTYHFPDGLELNLQAALLGEKIQDLQLTQPRAEYRQKLPLQIVTDEEILQLESQALGVYGSWFELGKNMLIAKACLLSPTKATCWLQILTELVTFDSLTFYLSALYSDIQAKKQMLQAQEIHEQLQQLLTKQAEQIVNLGALFVTPIILLEYLFAELIALLPKFDTIIAAYYSQVYGNRTFQDACRRLPTFFYHPEDSNQNSLQTKGYRVWHLFESRLFYLRLSYGNLKRVCQDFALAPEVKFQQPLLLKTAVKVELTTPWGKMPAALHLQPRTKTADLAIEHPEPFLRKVLMAWSKDLTIEELPLIINALGILPDRHEQ